MLENVKKDKSASVSFSDLFKGVTTDNFDDIYKTDLDCKRTLADIKWKDGFVCRHCSHTNFCSGSDAYSRRCTRCKRQESATAHTVFHSCKINLPEAFKIAFMVCCDPNISAKHISELLNKRHMTCLNFKKKVLDCKQGIVNDE